MTYTFNWKNVIHGQIEIVAESGVEAERIFHEMTLEQLLAASKVDTNDDALTIRYVNAGLGDIHTYEEWQNEFKHFT